MMIDTGANHTRKNPLEGCDQERTVFVDFVGNNAKYKTVQSDKNTAIITRNLKADKIVAVASLPNITGKIPSAYVVKIS
jgi:hypothetical protein